MTATFSVRSGYFLGQTAMFGGASGGGGNNMIKDVGSHSEQNRRFRDYMEVSDDGTA